jgi:hypothetical protein
MTKLLSFLGINVHQLVVSAALSCAAFFAGMAIANGWATHTAVVAVQAAADKTVAAVKADDAARLKSVIRQAVKDKQLDSKADASAHGELQSAKDKAAAAEALARAYFAKWKEAKNAYPSDDLVIGGADLRRVLDNAAGADGDGDAAAGAAAGGTDGAARAAATAAGEPLTLGDLKTGYVALGQYCWTGPVANLTGLQAWARARLIEPEAARAAEELKKDK